MYFFLFFLRPQNVRTPMSGQVICLCLPHNTIATGSTSTSTTDGTDQLSSVYTTRAAPANTCSAVPRSASRLPSSTTHRHCSLSTVERLDFPASRRLDQSKARTLSLAESAEIADRRSPERDVFASYALVFCTGSNYI